MQDIREPIAFPLPLSLPSRSWGYSHEQSRPEVSVLYGHLHPDNLLQHVVRCPSLSTHLISQLDPILATHRESLEILSRELQLEIDSKLLGGPSVLRAKQEVIQAFDCNMLFPALRMSNFLLAGDENRLEAGEDVASIFLCDRLVLDSMTSLVTLELSFCQEPQVGPIENLDRVLHQHNTLNFDLSVRLHKLNSASQSLPPRVSQPERGDSPLFRIFVPQASSAMDQAGSAHEVDAASAIFLQKIWSQMVNNNVTFAASSNYRNTLLFYRHRASQTMHVSGVIPHDSQSPSLLHTLVALLYTASQDMTERLQRFPKQVVSLRRWDLTDSKKEKKPEESSGQDGEGGSRGETSKQARLDREIPSGIPADHNSIITTASPLLQVRNTTRLGVSDQGKGGKRKRFDSVDARTAFGLVTHSCNSLSMIFRTPFILDSEFAVPLHRQEPCDVEHIVSPATTAIASLDLSTDAPRTFVSHDLVLGREGVLGKPQAYDQSVGCPGLLVLQQAIIEDGVYQVWRGYLDVEAQQVLSVIAKIAPFEELLEERDIYLRLNRHQVNGVPTLLGLYRAPEHYPEHPVGFLLLSDEGSSLGSGLSSVTTEEREVFFSILGDIHTAGVMHQNLAPRHLLRLKSGNKVTLAITDFSQSEIMSGLQFEGQETKEMEKVLGALESVGEH